MQNDLIKINQKKPRRLIIFLAILFILIGVFFVWFFIFYPKNQTKKSFLDLISHEETSSQIDNSQEKSTANLTLAEKILNQITSHQSEEDFYGDSQLCLAQTGECKVSTYSANLNPDLDKIKLNIVSSHRENIPVAWARFQYFKKTNDQKQLQLLKTDLKNVVEKILDQPNRVLQSNTLNCALLKEIADSVLVDEETKTFAKRLCFESEFEYHPQSNISYDQHLHSQMDFLPLGIKEKEISKLSNVSVGSLIDISRPDNEIINFNETTLTAAITKNLKLLINGQRQVYLTKVPLSHQAKFITRELLAAIDQGLATQFAQENNNLNFAQAAKLHNLILTEETLGWFNANPNLASNLDICLLQANLSQYLQNYPSSFTQEEKEKFSKILQYPNLPLKEAIICSLSQKLINQKNIDSNKLIPEISNTNSDQYKLPFGYFDYAKEGLVYPINTNAFLGGLLSI